MIYAKNLPSNERFAELVEFTEQRALTPDEHAEFRTGLQALADSVNVENTAIRRLRQERDTAQAAARERAAILEAARDLLEPWGGHGDAWPDITPAIETLTAELAYARAAHQATIVQARQWKASTAAERNCTVLAAAVARREAESERDGAYRERAHLTAWLATIHPAVITNAPDTGEPGWQLLYLNVSGHQLSWHIHPRDADLYTHVEHVPTDDPRAQWDGHTTDQKYETIRSLTFVELRGGSANACTSCGNPNVVYRNHLDQPLCCTCASCCDTTTDGTAAGPVPPVVAPASAGQAEERLAAVREFADTLLATPGSAWAGERLHDVLNGPKPEPACSRCRDQRIVPDFANWDRYHGEPNPKPCPDCVTSENS